MTFEEVAAVVDTARFNGRAPTLIKIGLGVARDWRRAMDERVLFAYATLPVEQRVHGVPFVVDPALPAASVEFVGL